MARNKNIPKKKKNKKSKSPVKREFFSKYSNIILFIILFIQICIAGLLFNGHIELMGDDAYYITGPYDFIKKGIFPKGHATIIYNVVLSAFSSIWGINILGVKLLSLLWGTICLVLSFYAFRSILPSAVLLGVLLIQAMNPGIQFWSSSVMSESFFMMVQVLFLLTIFLNWKHLHTEITKDSFRDPSLLASVSIVCVMSVVLSYSKAVGIAGIAALVAYLLVHRKWLNAILYSSVFLAFRYAIKGLVFVLFGVKSLAHHQSFDKMLLKNSYNEEEGKEDALGMIVRLWDNFNYYFSCDMLKILGLRNSEVGMLEPLPFVSFVFALLFIGALFFAFKHQKKLFFLGLYILIIAGAIFFALQTHWKQERMIVILIPLTLFFILGSFVSIKNVKNARYPSWLSWVGYSGLVILILTTFAQLPKAIADNSSDFQNVIQGNSIKSYTPDWQNYLSASSWCKEELPEASLIACRKPKSSQLYAGGKDIFHGIYKSTTNNGDVVLNELQQAGVTHLLVGSLRLDPRVAVPNRVVGTMYSYLRAIHNHDPTKLQLIKTFGDEEQAYVYKINY